MKKSLLLAALLLSSAAQAEMYICETKASAISDGVGQVSKGVGGSSYLINSTQGFKPTGPDWSYKGDCEFTSHSYGLSRLICIESTVNNVSIIVVNLDDLRFSKSDNFGNTLLAYTGQCSEL